MKKVILILFAFTLALFGCATTYAETDLINNGYKTNVDGNYELVIDEKSSVFVETDKITNEQVLISAEVYPSSYQTVALIYTFDNQTWVGMYYNGGNVENISSIEIDANDAYTFINSISPTAIIELSKLAEMANVDMAILEGGYASNVEDFIKDDLKISNIEITDTEPYLIVSYDISNISSREIDLDSWDKKICFNTSNDPGCDTLKDTDELYNPILTPGETINVQMKATDVPDDAYDFYIYFMSMSNGDYIETNVVSN